MDPPASAIDPTSAQGHTGVEPPPVLRDPPVAPAGCVALPDPEPPVGATLGVEPAGGTTVVPDGGGTTVLPDPCVDGGTTTPPELAGGACTVVPPPLVLGAAAVT